MAIIFPDIAKVENGAHFYNCDLHVHSFGGSHDVKDATMTVEAIIDEAVGQRITLLAVTDHNSDTNTQKSIDYAQKHAGQLLVLAGVEISTAHGHLLVYAAPDRAGAIRDLLGRIKLVGKAGDPDAHTAMSMADVIREAFQLGCISIAAHLDREKSGFEKLATGYPNWKKDVLGSPGLYGLECDDAAHLGWYSESDEPTDDGANRKQLYLARCSAAATMGRPELAHLQGSDAHSLAAFKAGRAGKLLTRFKLNELSFEAFRVALTMPEARVRALASIPRWLPRILGMHVAGGFLDGETYHYSANLNCFIGGRGTGKSTALKTLAYGLGIDDELDAYETGPGSVVVYCEDGDGVRYRYERVRGGRPLVKAKEDGDIVDVPESAFRVEYYRQGELAEVAKDPLKNPQLLQEFLDRHLILSDLTSKESQLVAALNQNSAQLIPLEGNAGQLPEKNKLLGEVNKKLTIAEEGKLKDIAAEQSQLSGERSLSQSLAEVKETYDDGLALANFLKDYDAMADVAKPLTTSADSVVALGKVKAAIARANVMLNAKEKEINEVLKQEGAAITTALGELKSAHGKIEATLNLKIADLQKKGLAGNIAELGLLLKQKEALTKEINQINGQIAQLKQLRLDRDNYLKELTKVREEITQRRKAQLASINQNLAKTISDYTVFVHYEPSGIVDGFKTFLLDAMQGTHFREDAAHAFCSAIMPAGLAKLLWNGDRTAIAAVGGIGAEWADAIVKQMRYYKTLHALEAMGKDADSLKARARILRVTINSLCLSAPLSESAAAIVIKKIFSEGSPGPNSDPVGSASVEASAAGGPAKRKRAKRPKDHQLRASAKKEMQGTPLDSNDPREFKRSGLVIPDGSYLNGHSWDAVDVTKVDAATVAVTIRPIDPQEHRSIPSVGFLWLENIERVQEFLRAKKTKVRFRLSTRKEAAFFDPDLSLGDWGITVINFQRFPKELQDRIKAAGFTGDGNGNWDNGEPLMETRIT